MSENYREKGNRLDHFVSDYVVFDLETTDKYVNYAEIIEISAIRVRNNEVESEFSTLVMPEYPIPASATQINNITNEMVMGAPALKEALTAFDEFIGDDILVGHNINTYDLNILYDCYLKVFDKKLQNDFLDTLYISKRCFPELDNHRLTTIGESLKLNIEGAHRALADCVLTNKCYQAMMKKCQEENIDIFSSCSCGSNEGKRRQIKNCSQCGRPMVLRLAKKGFHAGSYFWGCTGYPKCKNIVNISEEDQEYCKEQAIDPVFVEQTRKNSMIDYIALPYKGYCSMESFESIGVSKKMLDDISNDAIDENYVSKISKFRIDYPSEKKTKLTPLQRQICVISLRLLCRGYITINSSAIDEAMENSFSGIKYSNETFNQCLIVSKKNVSLNYDSKFEEEFATEVLSKALGDNWQNYTETQVRIDSLVQDGSNFIDQRVDFLLSDGTNNIVIEIDGEEHNKQKDKDSERDSLLIRNGFSVFRFTNEEVRDDKEKLIDIVQSKIEVKKIDVGESDELKEVFVQKMIHQVQIALLDGMIKSVVDSDDSVWINLPIKNKEKEINNLILLDLKNLLDQYCVLFGVEKFFVCKCDDIGANVIVSFGNDDEKNSILITDVLLDKKIRNRLPIFSDLEIDNTDEETILYFLKYCFRYKSFREGQYISISRLLERRDSIVLLPTGSGKSLIYQLGSLLAPGKIIVVEPLIALMEDQLYNLHFDGIDCAISVSSNNNDGIKEICNPAISMIYVSPERLQIQGFRNEIDALQVNNRIYTVAIDEAHCVSEWGHDFRTAYLNIGRTTRTVFNYYGRRPTLIALTGTASTAVLKDVKRELEINEYDAIITPETFNRKELHFKVVKSSSETKAEKLKELLNATIPYYFNSNPNSFYELRDEKTNGGIVFCPHANGDFGVSAAAKVVSNTNIKTDVYAGKELKSITTSNWEEYKRTIAKKFKQNKINTLVSTKAFGMGIDKPNVIYTVHYGIPSSIESFYQEAGRAGRGSSVTNALCTIILSDENEKEDDFLLNPITPLEEIKKCIDNHNIYDNDDVSRMLWFHVNSFKGIEFEMNSVVQVLMHLFEEEEFTNNPVDALFGYGNGIDNLDSLQKAIQRLLVLGVVSDYTIDYTQKTIKMYPGSIEKDSISRKFAAYVKGYNEGRVETELKKIDRIIADSNFDYVLAATRVLTEFVYDTIEKGRRRGLREIRNAALSALKSKNPDEEIRQRIIRYFETTYSDELNYIIDDRKLGFSLIPEIIDGREIKDSGEKVGGIRSCTEAAGLRGGASRYLESTPDHPGLLALRALAEVLCADFDINTIQTDIKASCEYALTRYSFEKKYLQQFLSYFVRKCISRDPELFYPISQELSKFIDINSICEEIIDDINISEESKEAPVVIYFNNKSKEIVKIISEMKGE